MKSLGSTKRTITKDRNGENVSPLVITEVVLANYDIVSNDYEHKSKVLYTFVPNTSFGQLLDISPSKYVFLKTFHSDSWYIKVHFTD